MWVKKLMKSNTKVSANYLSDFCANLSSMDITKDIDQQTGQNWNSKLSVILDPKIEIDTGEL